MAESARTAALTVPASKITSLRDQLKRGKPAKAILNECKQVYPWTDSYKEEALIDTDTNKPQFRCTCTINGRQFTQGIGASKKEAQNDAAKKALEWILDASEGRVQHDGTASPPPYSVRDPILTRTPAVSPPARVPNPPFDFNNSSPNQTSEELPEICRRKLQINHDKLVENLPLNDILPLLYKYDIVNSTKKDELFDLIKAGRTQTATQMFLGHLEKESFTRYRKFLELLWDKGSWLADLLENGSVPTSPAGDNKYGPPKQEEAKDPSNFKDCLKDSTYLKSPLQATQPSPFPASGSRPVQASGSSPVKASSPRQGCEERNSFEADADEYPHMIFMKLDSLLEEGASLKEVEKASETKVISCLKEIFERKRIPFSYVPVESSEAKGSFACQCSVNGQPVARVTANSKKAAREKSARLVITYILEAIQLKDLVCKGRSTLLSASPCSPTTAVTTLNQFTQSTQQSPPTYCRYSDEKDGLNNRSVCWWQGIRLAQASSPGKKEAKQEAAMKAVKLLRKTSAAVNNHNEIDHLPPSPVGVSRLEKYRMSSPPSAQVLIVNMKTYSSDPDHAPPRAGSEQDVAQLMTVFAVRCNFKVDFCEDLSSRELKNKVQTFAKSAAMAMSDCSIVVVMAHGSNGSVKANDGVKVAVKDIIEPFSKCPALTGKPKFFLFQACRGNEHDLGVVTTDSSFIPQPSSPIVSDEELIRQQIPTTADLLVGFACYSMSGSFYIKTFCEVFQEWHNDQHMMDILTEVKNRLCSKPRILPPTPDQRDPQTVFQMPQTQTTLRMNWYLYP